jgi:hypothetical protein
MSLNTYAKTQGVDITTAYTIILQYNPDRSYFELHNRTVDDIFITVGGSENDQDAFILGDKKVYIGDKIPTGVIKVRGNVAGRLNLMI